MNEIVFATAVPVAPPLDNGRPALPPRQPSNYQLPSSRHFDCQITEEQIRTLQEQGFTTGLAKALSSTKASFPLRIWVIDNSGSMQKDDGNRLVETKNREKVKIVRCTRWAEIQECVNYHAQLAALLRAPTSFRLLNDPGAAIGPQQFGISDVANDDISIQRDLHKAKEVIRKARPIGVTPLTEHIIEIQNNIQAMAPELVNEGKRVAIIIATDGLPTDRSGFGGQYEKNRFLSALRSLEGLPVWVVVRLCTDEEDVVDFYNDLDEQIEISVEVLDDFVGEALEVYEKNEWLNYALPLHRCREMGFHDRVFDMIDERALTVEELRDFFTILFGIENFDCVPDPAADWPLFISEIERILKHEAKQWNPVKKKQVPWVDIKALHKKYGDGSSCGII